MIHAARFLDLLRGHVGRGAEFRAALGQQHRVALFIENLGDAEVGDLHAAFRIEQDVLRFDVAMQHALRVRELQRVTDGGDDVQRLLRRETARTHGLAQVHAIDVFHDQEAKAAALSEIMHGDDVRMTEPRQHAALTREALREARRGREGLRQHFEGDDAIQLRLPRLENRAHAAVTDEVEDFEIGEGGGDFFQRGQIPPGQRQGIRIAIRRHGGCGHEGFRVQTVKRIGRWGMRVHDTCSVGNTAAEVTQKVALFLRNRVFWPGSS